VLYNPAWKSRAHNLSDKRGILQEEHLIELYNSLSERLPFFLIIKRERWQCLKYPRLNAAGTP
jgi:hypothetical protein